MNKINKKLFFQKQKEKKNVEFTDFFLNNEFENKHNFISFIL